MFQNKRENVMRAVTLGLLILVFAGCAYMPPDNSKRLQITARDGGVVYYGYMARENPAVVKLTFEIERRVFEGNLELTQPNNTFGLYERYGPRDAAPKPPEVLDRTNYMRAILSSSDRQILRCDFTDVHGRNAGGICVDGQQRIYDVSFG